MKNLISFFFILGFIKETQAMINHDLESEKTHYTPFSFLKTSFGKNVKNPLKSHYLRHKGEKMISKNDKKNGEDSKIIKELEIIKQKIEKLDTKPLSQTEKDKNIDFIIKKINPLINPNKSSLMVEIAEETSQNSLEYSSSHNFLTASLAKKELPSEPSLHSISSFFTSESQKLLSPPPSPGSITSNVSNISLISLSSSTESLPIPDAAHPIGEPSSTGENILKKSTSTLASLSPEQISSSNLPLKNKQSFFASEVKHRLIRASIITTIFYMKSLYSCYKMDPKISKIKLLKQSFQALKKDKFFYGGLLAALIIPKVYEI